MMKTTMLCRRRKTRIAKSVCFNVFTFLLTLSEVLWSVLKFLQFIKLIRHNISVGLVLNLCWNKCEVVQKYNFKSFFMWFNLYVDNENGYLDTEHLTVIFMLLCTIIMVKTILNLEMLEFLYEHYISKRLRSICQLKNTTFLLPCSKF